MSNLRFMRGPETVQMFGLSRRYLCFYSFSEALEDPDVSAQDKEVIRGEIDRRQAQEEAAAEILARRLASKLTPAEVLELAQVLVDGLDEGNVLAHDQGNLSVDVVMTASTELSAIIPIAESVPPVSQQIRERGIDYDGPAASVITQHSAVLASAYPQQWAEDASKKAAECAWIRREDLSNFASLVSASAQLRRTLGHLRRWYDCVVNPLEVYNKSTYGHLRGARTADPF